MWRIYKATIFVLIDSPSLGVNRSARAGVIPPGFFSAYYRGGLLGYCIFLAAALDYLLITLRWRRLRLEFKKIISRLEHNIIH